MAKLTYDEIMSMMREGITDELIEEVVDEMSLNEEIIRYPDEGNTAYAPRERFNKLDW